MRCGSRSITLCAIIGQDVIHKGEMIMKSTTAVKDPAVRYEHRNGYRCRTNRAQRADVLLLRLQVQREVRSTPEQYVGQVCGNAEERPGLLQLNPTTPRVNAMPTVAPLFPLGVAPCGLMSFLLSWTARGVSRGRRYGGSRSRPVRYGLRRRDLEGPAMRRSRNDV